MSGRFRQQYRQLSPAEQQTVAAIKGYAEQLEDLVEQVPEPRARALAMTKLEESVMWAVKGVTG